MGARAADSRDAAAAAGARIAFAAVKRAAAAITRGPTVEALLKAASRRARGVAALARHAASAATGPSIAGAALKDAAAAIAGRPAGQAESVAGERRAAHAERALGRAATVSAGRAGAAPEPARSLGGLAR